MTDGERKCLDCGGWMYQIQIIDRGAEIDRPGFEYAAPTAKRGTWSGAYPVEGKISAYLCQECGAVRLFGQRSD